MRLFGMTHPSFVSISAMALEVYGTTVGVKDALVHHLGESGMGKTLCISSASVVSRFMATT